MVFSVIVLGTVVITHLTSDLTLRLEVLETPSKLRSINISTVATGIVLRSVKGGGSIKDHVIESAYHVFHSGLERLLENAGGVGMLIATAIAAQTTDPRARIKLNPSSSDSRALGMLVSCDE